MNEETSIRNEICEIGRRIYARQFAAGNDGNISCRLSDDVVLCTPTLICKGYMQPEDLCTVDLAGNQLSGQRQRTSEILLHLEVYRKDPAVQAVVHCHPPHATAFAVARVDIPSGILPEVEVFLGVVPRAEYETPGSPGFAQTVRPFIGHANTVLLSNHGVVSWAPSLERVRVEWRRAVERRTSETQVAISSSSSNRAGCKYWIWWRRRRMANPSASMRW